MCWVFLMLVGIVIVVLTFECSYCSQINGMVILSPIVHRFIVHSLALDQHSAVGRHLDLCPHRLASASRLLALNVGG